MNCWISGLIAFLHVLCHIVAFISELPVILFIALWASFRFFLVVLRGTDFLFSRIPLYAVACVREESFAPGTSKSIGIARSRGSGIRLFAPCFARALLPSFPQIPLWPLTHFMVVLADLYLIRWAAFLNRLAFFIPIQPSFSQDSRWVVSPSMTYLESVSILIG